MIDLHTHTRESDGTLTPQELVSAAAQMELEALAITDHDTFAGYDQGVACARDLGLDLVCGIELSTSFRGRSVHVLGYFLKDGPSEDLRRWLVSLQDSRHQRNRRLVDKLRSKGIEITLEEVYQRGSKLPGRPHLAALMIEKGYVTSFRQAFDEYLGESSVCYTPREDPAFREGVQRIIAGSGLPSLPHPGRISSDRRIIEEYVDEMRLAGLRGIEAYHSDHSPSDTCFYESIAQRLRLLVTGGSDFHGATKPHVQLGTGIKGALDVPRSVLDDLRRG